MATAINLKDNSCYMGPSLPVDGHLDPIGRKGLGQRGAWDSLWSLHKSIENQNQQDAFCLYHLNNDGYEHNTNDPFFTLFGSKERFTVHTGNLVGFAKNASGSLTVGSRFGDSFLKYIIADADGFLEIEDIGGNISSDEYNWLLAYLWNIKLLRAYRLGIPKAYATQTERTRRVRGTIDPVDFSLPLMPAHYLCSYREHRFDIPANMLLIKAYKNIQKLPFSRRTHHIYRTLVSACGGADVPLPALMNTPYFTNPYFFDYNPLIDLSKKLLYQQGADFGEQSNSHGVFFDISMLFEYYLRKLIMRGGFSIRRKNDACHKIPTGATFNYLRRLEPDFVIENDGLYIFDAKYKNFDSKFGVLREDLFQLHTYVGQYANDNLIKGCGFIYPLGENRWDSFGGPPFDGIISDTLTQHGTPIPFHVLFLKVPGDEHADFNRRMREQSQSFMQTLVSRVMD